MTAAGAAASAWSPCGTAFEYRRSLVLAGEAWRLVTGQLVHWSARMALTDLGAVLLLGAWLERRSRRVAGDAVAAGAVASALVLVVLLPGLERYRGASGIASALFVAVALDLGAGTASRAARRTAIAALVLFTAKIAFEGATGRALFAGPLPGQIPTIPAVHAAGGLAGALAWGLGRRRAVGS